jgi:regulator of RNase E activity RraA
MTKFAAALLELGSAKTSDALRAVGKCFQAMDAGIRPLAPTMRTAGPAFTVRCYPGATWAMEQALELASPGDVLVVDGAGYPDAVLMGGLMSTRARQREIAGAVLDGAVRDVDQIRELPYPVFARHVCPRAGTFAEIGEWQTVVCCGRIPVAPGDWIVADSSGVAVVPADMLARVLEQATQLHRREVQIERSLKAGKNLSEAVATADPRES